MLRALASLSTVVQIAALGSGCASSGNQDVETERLLTAAGFQMRLGDSDDQRAAMSVLPQREIAPRSHVGRTFYVYADEDHCRCLFVGTQRAYDRYQRLALARDVPARRWEAAEEQADAALDISSFEPWGPWWW